MPGGLPVCQAEWWGVGTWNPWVPSSQVAQVPRGSKVHSARAAHLADCLWAGDPRAFRVCHSRAAHQPQVGLYALFNNIIISLLFQIWMEPDFETSNSSAKGYYFSLHISTNEFQTNQDPHVQFYSIHLLLFFISFGRRRPSALLCLLMLSNYIEVWKWMFDF